MAQVSGILQEIQTRKVSNGTKTAYDIVVGGQKYGAGLWAPKAQQGDYVTFNANQSQYGFDVERGTLKVGKAPPEEAKRAVQTNVKQAVGSYDARQDAISRQAASNTAIAWLTLLHAAGALPVSTSKSKGSQQEAMDIVRREYEKEFYESNTGNEWKNIRPGKQESSGSEDEAEDDAGEVDQPWE